MTPDERDRLVTLEQQYRELKGDVAEIKGDVKTLVLAYNVGQGAFKAIMKIGGLCLVILGALAWLYDHVVAWMHR